MKRRDLFKATTAAAALAAPGALPAQSPASGAAPPASAWKPGLLDAHENETVVALADQIIPATDTPGAKAANVNRYIDLYLKEGDPERRQAFLDGLHWMDAQSIARFGKPFVRAAAEQQTELLTAMMNTPGPGQDFFRLAKSLIADIYYKTPIGYRELNKGGRVPAKLGCPHAAKHGG
jgi:hypothetical protein